MTPTCVELFAGAGGVSVGLHQAGFHSLLAVEWDKKAHATLAAAGRSARAVCGDVRDTTLYEGLKGGVDLLWASAPCQVWSSTGKRLGAFDERNGWPWTFDAVDLILPRWVICENVIGILQHRKECPVLSGKVRTGELLELIGGHEDQVGLPPPEDCPGCYWSRAILPWFASRFKHVSWRVLNAADYGVPQRRERVILVAGPEPYPWPEPTHSRGSLLYDKWVSKTYWSERGLELQPRVASIEKDGPPLDRPTTLPWVTVRDVFAGIPAELVCDESLWVREHQLKRTMTFRREPADRVSMDPDVPAFTVTCRRGGAKTNDALIWEQDGRLRYLTVAEVAALQAFPSDHPWQGGRSARYKQVGNAVPPPLARALGQALVSLCATSEEEVRDVPQVE